MAPGMAARGTGPGSVAMSQNRPQTPVTSTVGQNMPKWEIRPMTIGIMENETKRKARVYFSGDFTFRVL